MTPNSLSPVDLINRLIHINDIAFNFSEKSRIITEDLTLSQALDILEEHVQNPVDQLEEAPDCDSCERPSEPTRDESRD